MLRVLWGFLRAHSGGTAVQDDAVGKPLRGGNRANRLILHEILLPCIPEHRWLALHSSVVAVPARLYVVAAVELPRVNLASAGREVVVARSGPSPSIQRFGATRVGLKRLQETRVPRARQAPDGYKQGGTQPTNISMINRRGYWLRLFLGSVLHDL